MLDKETRIKVELGEDEPGKNILVSSTLQLKTLEEEGDLRSYGFRAYGKNSLTFRNLDAQPRILDSSGNEVEYRTQEFNGLTLLSFEGRGEIEVVIK